MRQLILQMTVSVDGYVAGPQGGLGGTFAEDAELTAWKLERVRDAGAHIVGRVTYEQMAAYWPTATNAYAPFMNDLPKIVFSSTLRETPWGPTRVIRGPLADEVAALKQEAGKDLVVHGGASFVQALSRHGLIDEYRLVIRPVAVGSGLPLFEDLPKALSLTLVEARSFASGALANVYRPVRGR